MKIKFLTNFQRAMITLTLIFQDFNLQKLISKKIHYLKNLGTSNICRTIVKCINAHCCAQAAGAYKCM